MKRKGARLAMGAVNTRPSMFVAHFIAATNTAVKSSSAPHIEVFVASSMMAMSLGPLSASTVRRKSLAAAGSSA